MVIFVYHKYYVYAHSVFFGAIPACFSYSNYVTQVLVVHLVRLLRVMEVIQYIKDLGKCYSE